MEEEIVLQEEDLSDKSAEIRERRSDDDEGNQEKPISDQRAEVYEEHARVEKNAHQKGKTSTLLLFAESCINVKVKIECRISNNFNSLVSKLLTYI